MENTESMKYWMPQNQKWTFANGAFYKTFKNLFRDGITGLNTVRAVKRRKLGGCLGLLYVHCRHSALHTKVDLKM